MRQITDIPSLQTCQLCFRLIPILSFEVYSIFLIVKQLTKISSLRFYDKLDFMILLTSIITLSADCGTAIYTAIAISQFSIIMKMVRSSLLVVIFADFNSVNRKYLFTGIFCEIIVVFVSYWFCGLIYVKFILLALNVLMLFGAWQQVKQINILLEQQKDHTLVSETNFAEIELLEHQKQFQPKILSPEFKYHLNLRKTFCLVMIWIIWIEWACLCSFTDAKKYIGQIFVVMVVQVLPSLVYCILVIFSRRFIRSHFLSNQ